MKKNKIVLRQLDLFDTFSFLLVCLMLPMVLLQYSTTLPSQIDTIFTDYYYGIWGIFLIEFLVRLFRSKAKKSYVINNWIEIVIIFFPLLRVFRFIKVFEMGFLLFTEELSQLVHKFHMRMIVNTAAIGIVVVTLSSHTILFFEKPYSHTHIKSFGDALWWSTVGISTIGIGNVVPESIGGKILTIFLMVAGVILFGMVTANFAAFFTESDIHKETAKEITSIGKKMHELESHLDKDIVEDTKKLEKKIDTVETRLEKLEKDAP